MSTSTRSSFAYISDPDLSGSFATSFDGEAEYAQAYPSVMSGPSRRSSAVAAPVSMVSSGSSFQSSSHGHDREPSQSGGRLLTIHLEKKKPGIWPTLIKGPVDISLSPCVTDPYETPEESESAAQYNMDPTSLAFFAFEMIDVKNEPEKGFEYLA